MTADAGTADAGSADAASTARAVHALVTALPADRRPARDNGRLVFAAPWEARALGLAAASGVTEADLAARTAALASHDHHDHDHDH